MRLRTFWRSAFVLLLAFVTWQTLTPDPENTEAGFAIARYIAEFLFHDDRFADKVGHFIGYAALSAAAVFAHLCVAGRRALMIAALAVYGVALEVVQGIGGVRMAEMADAAANFSGALAAFPAALLIEKAWAKVRSA